MTYKGYTGSVEFHAEDEVFFGKIAGIRDLVSFEGDTVVKLKKAFKDAVEDYIETCRILKKYPDKAYKGSLNVRIKPCVHRMAAARSAALNLSLNQFVERVLEREVLGKD